MYHPVSALGDKGVGDGGSINYAMYQAVLALGDKGVGEGSISTMLCTTLFRHLGTKG